MNSHSPKRILEPKRIIHLTRIINPTVDSFHGQALVTFSYDDGLMNNYTLALPLHEQYQIPATFNIIAGRLTSMRGRSFRANEVLDCYRRGVEIASHSYYHDEHLTNKTDEEIHFEFGESKRVLSEVVPDVETVAIPFSQYDERVISIAKQYYKGIRVFGSAQNDIPPSDRYLLNCRIAVGNTTVFSDIKAAIDEAVTNNKWCIIMLHGINPDANNLGTYEITPHLLEETLQYVNTFSKSVLLPINTRDALRFMLGDSY